MLKRPQAKDPDTQPPTIDEGTAFQTSQLEPAEPIVDAVDSSTRNRETGHYTRVPESECP